MDFFFSLDSRLHDLQLPRAPAGARGARARGVRVAAHAAAPEPGRRCDRLGHLERRGRRRAVPHRAQRHRERQRRLRGPSLRLRRHALRRRAAGALQRHAERARLRGHAVGPRAVCRLRRGNDARHRPLQAAAEPDCRARRDRQARVLRARRRGRGRHPAAGQPRFLKRLSLPRHARHRGPRRLRQRHDADLCRARRADEPHALHLERARGALLADGRRRRAGLELRRRPGRPAVDGELRLRRRGRGAAAAVRRQPHAAAEPERLRPGQSAGVLPVPLRAGHALGGPGQTGLALSAAALPAGPPVHAARRAARLRHEREQPVHGHELRHAHGLEFVGRRERHCGAVSAAGRLQRLQLDCADRPARRRLLRRIRANGRRLRAVHEPAAARDPKHDLGHEGRKPRLGRPPRPRLPAAAEARRGGAARAPCVRRARRGVSPPSAGGVKKRAAAV